MYECMGKQQQLSVVIMYDNNVFYYKVTVCHFCAICRKMLVNTINTVIIIIVYFAEAANNGNNGNDNDDVRNILKTLEPRIGQNSQQRNFLLRQEFFPNCQKCVQRLLLGQEKIYTLEVCILNPPRFRDVNVYISGHVTVCKV